MGAALDDTLTKLAAGLGVTTDELLEPYFEGAFQEKLDEEIPCGVERPFRSLSCATVDEHLADFEIVWSCGHTPAVCASAWTKIQEALTQGPLECQGPGHAPVIAELILVRELRRRKEHQ